MTVPIVGPALKPSAEAETLASFDSVPLFMKSWPDEPTEDTALAALQSLVFEGTPDEVARNFKEQGNEYFKGKRYREAISFYNQGVDAKPTDDSVLGALLLNRAACNLELRKEVIDFVERGLRVELENYGSVLRDCSKVLSKDSKSSKAYYRSGQALIQLGRLTEALDCCARCLSCDPKNESIKMLQDKILKIKEEADEKGRRKLEQKRKEEKAKLELQIAYKERNVIVLNNPGGSSCPVLPHFDEDDPTGRTLVFPVFFLYPEYATSDVISKFHEDSIFVAHLEAMFPPHAPPPEWDEKGEYLSGNLVVYAATHRKRLLKVGKKMTLRDVFEASKEKEGQPRDGLELKDNCLTFVVMPKGDVETKWVEEYKRTRGDSA